MTYIEEYYQYLLDNPDKACNKVLTVYKKLVNDIKKPKQVSFFNKITEENEILMELEIEINEADNRKRFNYN